MTERSELRGAVEGKQETRPVGRPERILFSYGTGPTPALTFDA